MPSCPTIDSFKLSEVSLKLAFQIAFQALGNSGISIGVLTQLFFAHAVRQGLVSRLRDSHACFTVFLLEEERVEQGYTWMCRIQLPAECKLLKMFNDFNRSKLDIGVCIM